MISKVSSCEGWTCAAATAPFGVTNVSTTTDSPFVSAAVVRKTSVSPVTWLVRDWPRWIIVLLLLELVERVVCTVDRAAYDPPKVGLRRV